MDAQTWDIFRLRRLKRPLRTVHGYNTRVQYVHSHWNSQNHVDFHQADQSTDPNNDDDEPFPRSRLFASSVNVDQDGQKNTRLLIARTSKSWRETGSMKTQQTRRSKYGEKEVSTHHLSLEPGYPGTALPVFGTAAWRLDHRRSVPGHPTIRIHRPSLPITTADTRCRSLKALGFGSAATTVPPLSPDRSNARQQPVMALPPCFLGCGDEQKMATVSLTSSDIGSPLQARPEGVVRRDLDTDAAETSCGKRCLSLGFWAFKPAPQLSDENGGDQQPQHEPTRRGWISNNSSLENLQEGQIKATRSRCRAEAESQIRGEEGQESGRPWLTQAIPGENSHRERAAICRHITEARTKAKDTDAKRKMGRRRQRYEGRRPVLKLVGVPAHNKLEKRWTSPETSGEDDNSCQGGVASNDCRWGCCCNSDRSEALVVYGYAADAQKLNELVGHLYRRKGLIGGRRMRMQTLTQVQNPWPVMLTALGVTTSRIVISYIDMHFLPLLSPTRKSIPAFFACCYSCN
ncbi:hypothetical protein QR685DRAFT_541538 [Neurospora intermedia]|uniref:Uncharacterized protein n=1 Tax=Neurospora intermedia TaxID=5142 RepID=A0ABR3DJS7_NEUIN